MAADAACGTQTMLDSLATDVLSTICTLLPTEDVQNFRLTARHCASAAYAEEDLSLDVPGQVQEWHQAFLAHFTLLKRLYLNLNHDQGQQLTLLLVALLQQPETLTLFVQNIVATEQLISSIESCRPKETLAVIASMLHRLPFSTVLSHPPPAGMPDLTVSCLDIFHNNAFFNPAISHLTIRQFTAAIANPFRSVDLEFMDVFDRAYMPNLQQLSITMHYPACIPVTPQTADLSQLTVLEMRRARLVDSNISFLSSGAPNLTRLVLQSDTVFPSEGFHAKSWPRMTSMHLEASSGYQHHLPSFPGDSLTYTYEKNHLDMIMSA